MRLGALVIVAVGIAGMVAYDQYDKKVNYQRVDARVSAVSERCFLEKVERGAITKTTYTSDLLPCDVAQRLSREHPKWQGYDVRHKIEVQVAYVSPVDGVSHASSLQAAAFPNGKPLHPGDVLAILASKTKPDKTRWT
ncbi:hypothetical protein IC762_20875 [Bradyrhizobium genosp. L]|uniref:hypothetical protein n=1 Tax=Bradyrhizobium genosp. L TaxID=83637 RepID=UPI0018A25849|nr:hypothetical protein [Bradyrhizobium genosp. L]QPF82225.1 hypothetical protein IC762_20875 [Bradyrhizobium genosp. L]